MYFIMRQLLLQAIRCLRLCVDLRMHTYTTSYKKDVLERTLPLKFSDGYQVSEPLYSVGMFSSIATIIMQRVTESFTLPATFQTFSPHVLHHGAVAVNYLFD